MRVIGSAGCADKHLSSQGATQMHYSITAKAKPSKSGQTCMLIMTRLLVQTTCLSAARHWTMTCSRKTCHSKACPSTMACRTSSCGAWQTSPDQNANRRGLLPATDRINADNTHADNRVQTSLAAALVRLLLLLDASNHRLHVMRARAMLKHIDPTTGKPRLRSRPHGLRACKSTLR